MSTAARWLVGGLAVVGGLALLIGVGAAFRGVSSRPEPLQFEVTLARSARHLLVPRAARARPNPVHLDDGVLDRSRAHFADHCATCHGNDGRGDTSYGRGLYPRAPDLTAPGTQSLSDGELFYLIENGVRLTGMPAFSTAMPEGETESWELVHFIRHLPGISQEELSAMARLNRVSRSELERELQIEEFLDGEAGAPPAVPKHREKGRLK